MHSIAAGLTAGVDAVAAVAVDGLSIDGLQGLVSDLAQARIRIDGVLSRAVGEIAVRGGGQVPDPAVAGAVCPLPAWLRQTAKVSGPVAGEQVRTSVALRELPQVGAAIIDGRISREHGRVLTRLVGKIDAAALLASQPGADRGRDPHRSRSAGGVRPQPARHLVRTGPGRRRSSGAGQKVPAVAQHPPRLLAGQLRAPGRGDGNAADRP